MCIVLVLTTLAATVAVAIPVRSKAHRPQPVAARAHRSIHPAERHPQSHPPSRRAQAPSHPRAEHPWGHHRSDHPSSRRHKRPIEYRRRRQWEPRSLVPRPAHLETVSLRRGRWIVPPPLRGSLESLERQNQRADAEGLERILDENDLENRIAEKLLVPVPISAALTVNPELPEDRRYCRPWTAEFLRSLARAHDAQFHRPLEVSSAVRTVAYQKMLLRTNGNAAAAEGDLVSPHLTGATIDIAKHGMTRQEVGWMRARLLPLQMAGKIDVEEEFRQACFHITVYKSYAPPAADSPLRKAGRETDLDVQRDSGGQ